MVSLFLVKIHYTSGGCTDSLNFFNKEWDHHIDFELQVDILSLLYVLYFLLLKWIFTRSHLSSSAPFLPNADKIGLFSFLCTFFVKTFLACALCMPFT